MGIEKDKIKNILVVRNDRFGEFLLNIPALRALKQTFVNAKITAIVDPYVRDLADCIPFIDEVIEWTREKRLLTKKINLVNLLKKKKIDMAIMLNPSKEFNILTYLAGIPIRVGYDRKWGFLLTDKIKDRKYLGEKHEIEYNLELVSLVGAKTENKSLDLKIDNDPKSEVELQDGNLVAIHPWTSDAIKQWPLGNFCALAKKLIKELNLQIIIVGGKEESERSKDIFGDFDNQLIDLTGKTNLKQLAALLKKVKLLISGDSGPVHLACAVGTPVIALFRSDIPGKSAKRWRPWGEGNMVIEKNNLDDITVDEVFNKVKERIDR